MSAAFWKVFELAISVWENILLLEFCMDFMQQKPRGKKGKVLLLELRRLIWIQHHLLLLQQMLVLKS